MKIIDKIEQLTNLLNEVRNTGGEIGLVPTMGYLHAGHQHLIKAARQENKFVVVSIFVNPLQFGPNEDFNSYPRDLARDSALAAEVGADIIFAPSVEEMYPRQSLTHVDVSLLGDWLCGKARPGHFRGVATVVSKLFNIVRPNKAYFGKKDAQQLAIINQMVFDLNFPVVIVPVPIVREADGLAMSSRNVFLSTEERSKATVLYRSLLVASQVFQTGERRGATIRKTVLEVLSEVPEAVVDYIEICDPLTLQPVEELGQSALVAMAVRFGKTRLIDNIDLEV